MVCSAGFRQRTVIIDLLRSIAGRTSSVGITPPALPAVERLVIKCPTASPFRRHLPFRPPAFRRMLAPVIRIVFWALIALDLLGILVLYLLGLAAARSAGTNPLQVTLLLLILPCIPLLGAIVLFSRSVNPLWRLLALALAAAPLLIAITARAAAEVRMRAGTNAQGEMVFFRPGPMREIAEAIARNDAATVTQLAATVDVNQRGVDDMTVLVLAMRQLRRTPRQHDALRALLAAGADPNAGAQSELPLAIALQVADSSGPEPVRALLDAGANPNLTDDFGVPVWFAATGRSSNNETLAFLLDRGADVNAVTPNGATALFSAAATRNWSAAHLLLERGADPSRGRSANGLPFRNLIDSYAGTEGADTAFAAVKRLLEER
jgi:ankyrin repeat protein